MAKALVPRKPTIILVVTVLSLGVAIFVLSHSAWWRFVWRLQHHSDPRAVQYWGEVLRREHEHDAEPYMDSKAINLPPGIADVLSFKPILVLFEPSDDYVTVSWGRGYPIMLIGSPTFTVTNRFATAWVRGVYLIKPHE